MHHEDEVRLIAYELWEQEGRPEGQDMDHWLRAEAIWAERQLPRIEESPSKPAVRKTRRAPTTKRRTTARRSAK